MEMVISSSPERSKAQSCEAAICSIRSTGFGDEDSSISTRLILCPRVYEREGTQDRSDATCCAGREMPLFSLRFFAKFRDDLGHVRISLYRIQYRGARERRKSRRLELELIHGGV